MYSTPLAVCALPPPAHPPTRPLTPLLRDSHHRHRHRRPYPTIGDLRDLQAHCTTHLTQLRTVSIVPPRWAELEATPTRRTTRSRAGLMSEGQLWLEAVAGLARCLGRSTQLAVGGLSSEALQQVNSRLAAGGAGVEVLSSLPPPDEVDAV